jgi:uncharacterized protein YbaR (Trm112 family)
MGFLDIIKDNFFQSSEEKNIANSGCYLCGSRGRGPNDVAVCPDCGIAFCWRHGIPGRVAIIGTLACPKCGKKGKFVG